MIVSRTPMRVTLGGGGTDLPSFYSLHGGFVFAMTINKYMYVSTAQPFADDKIRVHYSKSEEVDDVNELKHELAREALKFYKIEKRFIVSSIADIPGGTGLGSSSCYLVGLLNNLQHHVRKFDPSTTRNFSLLLMLAEQATKIELGVLGKRIGKQDQYMAALGGLTALNIAPSGSVTVERVVLHEDNMSRLVKNTQLYYTGQTHDTIKMLRNQDGLMRYTPSSPHLSSYFPLSPIQQDRKEIEDSLLKIKDLGMRSYDAIGAGKIDEWGSMLHEHWEAKKKLSKEISFGKVDQLYDHVRKEYGVLGGKIVGAGGGGFLLLYAPSNHDRLEAFMKTHNMPRLDYQFESSGSEIVGNV